MAKEVNSSEAFNEFVSFLVEGKGTVNKVKHLLTNLDLSRLSRDEILKMASLYSPEGEFSDELFKRQVDLYFSMLMDGDKTKNIRLLSDFIEHCYGQKTQSIPDKKFDIMVSRLLKKDLSEMVVPDAVAEFMKKLPSEFARDIDKLSNARMDTLVKILKGIDTPYAQMTAECQNFIKSMFVACAVKTEIADKNKQEIRSMFKDDPRGYYNAFNKAFAGFDLHDTWIDEPAKKLSRKNMINYANFQEAVIHKCKRGLYFSKFQSCARDLRLPRLPRYEEEDANFETAYLQEPREYKDYAKKLAPIFMQMIEAETINFAQKRANGLETDKMTDFFAPTDRMKVFMEYAESGATPYEAAMRFANALMDMIHIDQLTGVQKRNILNLQTLKSRVAVPKYMKNDESTSEIRIKKPAREEFEGDERLSKLEKRLDRLYDRYHELLEMGKRDNELEGEIVDLERRIRDYKAPDQFGDE